MSRIRTATPADQPALLHLAVACSLFEADHIEELGEMMGAALAGELPDHYWTTDDNKAAAYYAPETFADGVWNLYFIGVLPDLKGKGLGSALLQYVENNLRRKGQRMLIIETSGLDGFALTRRFYLKHGYEEEARIRDYYQKGEDKVVFRKVL